MVPALLSMRPWFCASVLLIIPSAKETLGWIIQPGFSAVRTRLSASPATFEVQSGEIPGTAVRSAFGHPGPSLSKLSCVHISMSGLAGNLRQPSPYVLLIVESILFSAPLDFGLLCSGRVSYCNMTPLM